MTEDFYKGVLVVFIVLASAFWVYQIGTSYFAPNSEEITVVVDMPSVEIGKSYKATKVQVIQGHVFDIYLENGKRYLVALDGVAGTPEEAKQAIVNHLNDSKRSGGTFHVIFRRWDAVRSLWLVDCFTGEGSEASSVKLWLSNRSLLYEY